VQWRILGLGALVGVALFVLAAWQVLDAIWPRPPAPARPAAEIDARWEELSADLHDDVEPELADPALRDVMVDVGEVPDEEPVPIEVIGTLAEVLDGGASVPHYGCTVLPLQTDPSDHISPFDWLAASEGLVDIGRPDLALRIARELREGQDLIPFGIGVGIHRVAVDAFPDIDQDPPTADGLYRTTVHAAQCADEVMARFDWSEADEYFGQGRVPPSWWYDPAADRRALRDFYLDLLAAMAPHRDDPAAMRAAVDAFEARPHAADRALLSRILTIGTAPILAEQLDHIASLQR